jgi:O-antigen/teichoic acid export membrane protein
MRDGHTTGSGRSDATTLAAGASVVLSGRVIGRVFDLATQVVLARTLSPEGFGLYVIGWTIFRMGGITTALGLDNGVLRYAPRYWPADPSGFKGVLKQAIGGAVLSGGIAGVGLFLLAPWIAEHVFRSAPAGGIIRAFGFAFFLYAGLKVTAVATTVSQKMQYAAYAVDITQPVTYFLFVVICATLGLGLEGAVAAGISSFAIAFCLALYYLWRLFPRILSPEVPARWVTKELLTFSLPTLCAGTLTLSILWADRLLVGYYLAPAEVGMYHAASQVAMVFAAVLDAFGAVFSPMIAGCFHRGETERLAELFKISTKWGLYLSLPLFLVIIFFSREVMETLFGHAYEQAGSILVLMAVAQLVNVGTGVASRLLILTGYHQQWVWLSAAALMVNILLICFFIPLLGLMGAALGAALSIGGLFLIGLYQVKRSLGLWPYDRRYWKGAVAAGLTAGSLLLYGDMMREFPLVRLLFMIGTSFGVFTTTLIVLGLDKEERELLARTFPRLGMKTAVEPA